jgi:hypothetical protein
MKWEWASRPNGGLRFCITRKADATTTYRLPSRLGERRANQRIPFRSDALPERRPSGRCGRLAHRTEVQFTIGRRGLPGCEAKPFG